MPRITQRKREIDREADVETSAKNGNGRPIDGNAGLAKGKHSNVELLQIVWLRQKEILNFFVKNPWKQGDRKAWRGSISSQLAHLPRLRQRRNRSQHFRPPLARKSAEHLPEFRYNS